MITYYDIVKIDTNSIQLTIKGDGVGTQLKAILNKPPFNLTFNGILPAAIQVVTNDVVTATGTVALVITDIVLLLTCSAPIPIAGVAPEITFIYNSAP